MLDLRNLQLYNWNILSKNSRVKDSFKRTNFFKYNMLFLHIYRSHIYQGVKLYPWPYPNNSICLKEFKRCKKGVKNKGILRLSFNAKNMPSFSKLSWSDLQLLDKWAKTEQTVKCVQNIFAILMLFKCINCS